MFMRMKMGRAALWTIKISLISGPLDMKSESEKNAEILQMFNRALGSKAGINRNVVLTFKIYESNKHTVHF